MRIHGIFAASVLAISVMSGAQSLDTARALAEDGFIVQAVAELDSVITSNPKDHDAMLLQGRLLWGVGQGARAKTVLEKSRKLGNNEAVLALAEIAAREYRTDDARQFLESLKPKPRRGKRAADPSPEVVAVEELADRIDDMLTRVEAVKLVDSVNVPADEFFKHYRLSPESGRLAGGEVLPGGVDAAEGTVVYIPQSQRQMIWAAPDTAGNSRLVWADALYGNQWETPRFLGDALAGEAADAAYPFMMPDGITLYYAADGPDSLGGYDIFMARRTDDGFLEPVNLGMPFNSPYNDYMMAIDEVTGIGWFASDRNRVPGQVTIYTYIPAEIRVNVAEDDPALREKALLIPMAAAKADDADIQAARKRLAAIADNGIAGGGNDFEIYIPGCGVVTRYSQLQSGMARQAAKNYVDAMTAYNADLARLADARLQYARGATGRQGEISSLEQRVEQARTTLAELLNQVVASAQ